MMTKNHQQTQLSRADLLWSFAAVEKQQQEDLAVLLGFEKRKNLNSANITLGTLVVKARGTSEIVTEQPQKIVQSQQTASYYRLTEITHDSKTEDSVTLEETNDLPDWYKDTKPSYFSKTKSSIPLIHQTPPVFQPLMPWSRLWPFLYRVLGASDLSNKADLVKLVDQVAQGKTIRHLPRLQHQTWSEFSQILIDINETNFPYRNDFFYLCDQLKKLRGEQGLDIQYLNDEPGGAVIRYNNQQEIIKPWVMPSAECKLLILSDLGMYTKSRRIVYDWLVFGQQLAVQG